MKDDIPVIKRTTDYSIFKTIKGNRRVYRDHVAQITYSVSNKNLLAYDPILVNERMQVIDGQHRLQAAISMKLPIFYMIVDEADIQDIRLLNSTMRSWTLENFLVSYIETGNKEYIRVREFMETYEMGVSLAIELLGSVNLSNSLALKQTFRRGTFKIINYDGAVDLAQKILELRPYLSEYVKFNRSFLRTIMHLYKTNQMNHEEFLEKLKITGRKIPALRFKRDYIRVFEDIINFRRVGKQIRLY